MLCLSYFYYLREYGGPDGELGAAIRYLSQRFTMVTPEAKAILNDIGICVSKLHIFKVAILCALR